MMLGKRATNDSGVSAGGVADAPPFINVDVAVILGMVMVVETGMPESAMDDC